MDIAGITKLVEQSIAGISAFVMLWFFLREMMKNQEEMAKQMREDHVSFAKQLGRVMRELGVTDE